MRVFITMKDAPGSWTVCEVAKEGLIPVVTKQSVFDAAKVEIALRHEAYAAHRAERRG